MERARSLLRGSPWGVSLRETDIIVAQRGPNDGHSRCAPVCPRDMQKSPSPDGGGYEGQREDDWLVIGPRRVAEKGGERERERKEKQPRTICDQRCLSHRKGSKTGRPLITVVVQLITNIRVI